MDIEQQIGQLFLIGFQGTAVTEDSPIVEDIRLRNLGGVILFDRFLAGKQPQNNIISASQVRSLTHSLQGYADCPLLIAVDQEGGLVKRLKPAAGFPETASAQTLGDTNDISQTRIHAACTAAMLSEAGINFNLAPVADLNIYPANPVIGALQRSFSSSSDTVITHASQWVAVHKKQNILSCLKHFPGHGSSRTDSHLGFTDISSSWNREELLPFQSLIRSGHADSIMLAHVFHKELDPTFPASLSPAVVTTLLREQLGFDGLLLTDDMQMKAITNAYGLEEAVCFALAAGVDMIIVGNNLDYDPHILQKLISAVLQAVKEKKISEERIQQAWKRVQLAKEMLRGKNNDFNAAC